MHFRTYMYTCSQGALRHGEGVCHVVSSAELAMDSEVAYAPLGYILSLSYSGMLSQSRQLQL